MSRPKDPEIEIRDKEICERWINRVPLEKLATDYGLSESAVHKIIKSAGLKKEHRVGPPLPRQAGTRKESISQLHICIGQSISAIRIIELDLSISAFSKLCCLSGKRLAEIEAGSYQVTLTELQRIAAVIERPLVELISGKMLQPKKTKEFARAVA